MRPGLAVAIAAVLVVAALLVVVLTAQECRPGAPGLRIGGILVGGC